MNFKTTELFDKQAKKLNKKYKNLKNDLNTLINNFDNLHQQATSIQKNLYKIRLANSNNIKTKVKVLVIPSTTIFKLKRLLTF